MQAKHKPLASLLSEMLLLEKLFENLYMYIQHKLNSF